MDTTKLVVGQEVWIFDDYYNRDIGKVTRITPDFVELTINVDRIPEGSTPPGVKVKIGDKLLMRFDINGNCEDGQFYPGGYGVWHIGGKYPAA
jgi:hypothetical protein